MPKQLWSRPLASVQTPVKPISRAPAIFIGVTSIMTALSRTGNCPSEPAGEEWIFSIYGSIQRRQGRWEESTRDLERAIELDPRNVLTLQQLVNTTCFSGATRKRNRLWIAIGFRTERPVTQSMHAFAARFKMPIRVLLRELTESIRDKNPARFPGSLTIGSFARLPNAIRCREEGPNRVGENTPSLGRSPT